ncbi:MAG TPA: CPBP family intramembrane glutamic endopeptidase [Capillimicrobium sp.]|nr:CPBP family intramembrane glutamic endopeptidase [Capillimicrobium sp.]
MSTNPVGGDPERPAFAPPVAPEPRLRQPVPAAPPPEPGAAPDRPWPWWSGFAALVAGWLSGQVLAGIAITVGDPGGGSSSDTPIGVLVIAQLLFSLCLVGGALLFANAFGRLTPERFGLRGVAPGRAVLWVVGGLLASWIVASVWLTVVGADSERDELTKRLTDDPSVATVVGLGVLTVVVAPVVEEVVFRGFLFNALRSAINVPLAAIVSGLVFGVVHAAGSPWQFLLPLAAFGTILALVYWRTGSLYTCIAMHAIWNCVSFGAARDWTWEILPLLAGSGAAIAAILLFAVRIGDRRPKAA